MVGFMILANGTELVRWRKRYVDRKERTRKILYPIILAPIDELDECKFSPFLPLWLMPVPTGYELTMCIACQQGNNSQAETKDSDADKGWLEYFLGPEKMDIIDEFCSGLDYEYDEQRLT